jgi:hypothetical protein
VGRLKANGVEMRAHTLFTAPARAVSALQRETGMKLEELIERSQSKDADSDTWSLKATEYLSEQARGNLLTWDQIWDRPLPSYQPDEDEKRRAAEDGEGSVPPQAGTGTPADDAPAVPDEQQQATTSTPRSRRSGPRSPGSTARSAPAR